GRRVAVGRKRRGYPAHGPAASRGIRGGPALVRGRAARAPRSARRARRAVREGGSPGRLRGLDLGRHRLGGTARTLLRRRGIRAFPRLGVAGERHPTSQGLPPALERVAARYGVGGSPLDLGGRGSGPDERKAIGDPDRVSRARLDAAGLFGVSSQGGDGPSTCTGEV
ncbi:MAG: hypothetical protein AVDCRST_MAG14-637, partial [uncultured Rubrobacteraceae bacterium]